MSISMNKHNLVVNCSPLTVGPANGTKNSPDKVNKPKLKLLQGQPAADARDWYGNIPLHHASTVDPPDLFKVKALLRDFPDGAKIRNQFGRIPLHCAVDKIFCSLELVRILVEAYPEGAAEEDHDGYSPLSCALRWEHKDIILKAILLHNRFQYRGLYFVIRYGVILGNLFHCLECTFKKSRGRGGPPSLSYSVGTSHDAMTEDGEVMQGSQSLSVSLSQSEEKIDSSEAPATFLSPPTTPKVCTRPKNSMQHKGYPEIIVSDSPTSEIFE